LGNYIGSRVEPGNERSEQIDSPETSTEDNANVSFDEPTGMEVEDFLDDTDDDSTLNPDPHLVVEGEKFHNSPIITSKLTPKGARKATMQTLHVCGVTLDNLCESDHFALNSENLTPGYVIKNKIL